jgi:DNA-binding LacI/PurR family transcriptional regulator
MAEQTKAGLAAGPAPRSRRGRRPTMRDVAARVGVSQQLVSLVFRDAPGASEQTRQRVFAAAAELGYSPDAAAQTLRRSRSGHLGVLFTMAHPFDLDLVENIYPAAERAGYDVVLGAMTAQRDERKAIEQLMGYRTEALILIGPELRAAQLSDLATRTPVVEVGRRMSVPGVDCVRTDDYRGVRRIVDYLVSAGHRSIVHVDGGRLPGAQERRRGYKTGMRAHRLDANITVIAGDYTEESGARAARLLLDEERLPTAVVAGNDQCAAGLLGVFGRAGVKVPEDISIVGYDDSHTARLSYVGLTTIRQDPVEMATQVIHAVTERLDRGRREDREIVVDPSLVVRDSTSAPRP